MRVTYGDGKKIVKFDNGDGALLCNECGTIIAKGFNHIDKRHFCNDLCRNVYDERMHTLHNQSNYNPND